MDESKAPQQQHQNRLAKHMFNSLLHVASSTVVGFSEEDKAYVTKLVKAGTEKGSPNYRIGAITTDNCVKVYDYNVQDPSRLQYTCQFKGHGGKVTDCNFHENSNLLVSSSWDQTVALWDVRSPQKPQFVFKGGSMMYSCDINGNTVAAGGDTDVTLWDIRTQRQSRSFEGFHTLDIFVTKFMPSNPSRLWTASEDNTVCQFDLAVEDDDDALLTVMNTEQSVGQIGFFGPNDDYLWARSMVTKSLSLWRVQQADRIAHFPDMRPSLSAAVGTQMDYIMGCHYNPANQRLFLCAGTNSGGLTVSHLQMDGVQPFTYMNPQDGHTAQIRDYLLFDLPDGSTSMITGGEDSKICVWTTKKETETRRPNMSMKTSHSERVKQTSPSQHRPGKPY